MHTLTLILILGGEAPAPTLGGSAPNPIGGGAPRGRISMLS